MKQCILLILVATLITGCYKFSSSKESEYDSGNPKVDAGGDSSDGENEARWVSNGNFGRTALSSKDTAFSERCEELFPLDLHIQNEHEVRLMGTRMYLRGPLTGPDQFELSGVLKESSYIPGDSITFENCSGIFTTEQEFDLDCTIQVFSLDEDAPDRQGALQEDFRCNARYTESFREHDGLAPTGEDLEGAYRDFGEANTEQAVDNSGAEDHECRLGVGRLDVSIEAGLLTVVDRARCSGPLPDENGQTYVEGDAVYAGIGKRYEESYACDLRFFYLNERLHVDQHCLVTVDFFDLETGGFLKTTVDDCYGLSVKVEP